MRPLNLRVGKSTILDNKTHRYRKFSYKDVEYDADKWADAKKYSPADFDLVDLKTNKGPRRGWFSKSGWDGLRLKNVVIEYWKKRE